MNMYLHRTQAWLTCVSQSSAVSRAVVLATSLRKTGTTRRIGVIISGQISTKEIKVLRQAFDDLFLVNDILIPNIKQDYLRGKVFAFSLEVFEKCVFVDVNSIIFGNGDKMFENQSFAVDSSGNWETFCFTPNAQLCDFLCQVNNKNGCKLTDGIQSWLENNDRKSNDNLAKPSIWKICLNTGHLILPEGMNDCTPILATFINAPDDNEKLVRTLKEIVGNSSIALAVKTSAKQWLDIYENQVAPGIVATGCRLNRVFGELKSEPIAIVGMSCRFPGASNLEEFWDLLYAGQDAISKPPAFRWTKEQAIYRDSARWKETEAGFLSVPVDEFDSKFFGISPKDAELLDPQARLLHEVMWESLENGGIDPKSLYGSHTGIFTGSWMNDYKDIVQSTSNEFFRTYMGNSIGATAARLSFLLGLTGPSIATESGCSSAIVALDLAVKSLRNGETNLAITGGVNLLLHPFDSGMIEFIVSPTGRCKTFDENADGFVRAEACGVLVLKRLSDALRDRDNIWALVRGSAVSQEGISRSLGTPTVHCEALAMELALKDAGVSPEQVSFVETHGTGTKVGDPMEVAAIAKAYHSKPRKEPLIIGSVKTNVGHTESCSGITGIIKTVLAMQHELIPKHLNLNKVNPEVKLEAIPAKIPIEPIPWPKTKDEPRLAGVSSYGITGTDGHVILQEAPDNSVPQLTWDMERSLHLIKLSAKADEDLDEILQLFVEALKNDTTRKVSLENVAYTANAGRASFEHRVFLLARNYDEAIQAIEANKVTRGEIDAAESGRKLCFLFTGQGSQYPGMAKLLYDSSPVFRVHFDQCNLLLMENYNLSIRQILWESDAANKSKELSRTIYSQTSIFVVEYCLLKLWESWGIQPDYVVGHSLGEYCAAVAAGILTFEDALKLVAERSRLIDNLPRGSMLVVRANDTEVSKLLKTHKIDLDIAAINSTEQTVVAGDTDKVLQFLDVCKSSNLKAIVLEATHAFHSRHMDPILNQFAKIATTVGKAKGVKCQFISGMTGNLIKSPNQDVDVQYWVRHTREKVSFQNACQTLKQLGCHNFLEIGPQPVLSTFVLQNIENFSISCFPSLRRNTNEWETILTSLGNLYLKGYNVDWEAYDKPYTRKKVPSLPFYPFHRKSYWVECLQTNLPNIHPLLGRLIPSATNQHIFQNDIKLKALPYLKDHCIGNMTVFPGAGYTEMCLTAGYCVANAYTEAFDMPTRAVALENVRIDAPLELKEGKSCRVQTITCLKEAKDNENTHSGFECKVYHQNENDDGRRNWVLHASATFHPFVRTGDLLHKWDPNFISSLISNEEPVSVNNFYKTVDAAGLKFGEQFKALQKYWSVAQENGPNDVVAEMNLPADYDKYLLHPLMLDSMMQTAILSVFQTTATSVSTSLRVPVCIGRLTLLTGFSSDLNKSGDVIYFYSKWNNEGKVTVFLCTKTFDLIAIMEDLELIETNVKTIQSVLQQQSSKVPDSWQEVWKQIQGPLDNRVKVKVDGMQFESLMSRADFIEKFRDAESKTTSPKDTELYRKAYRYIYLITLKTLLELGWKPKASDVITIPEFCEKFGILSSFAQLMRYYFNMFQEEAGILEISTHDENKSWKVINVCPTLEEMVENEAEALYQELRQEQKHSVVTETYQHVGSQLADILKGKVSPLPILFPEESQSGFQERKKFSAETFYQNYPYRAALTSKVYLTVANICQHLRDSSKAMECDGSTKSVLRVLEVGSGTGSMSGIALEKLSQIWDTDFEYYFTDVSASFFLKAEQKFGAMCKGTLKFCTFDVENPPLGQSIPVNYFDLVFATDVLHATKDLKETLRNIRQTLRPQGTFYFTETFVQDREATFVFGLLDGYWRFEDLETRPTHCCVGSQTWKRLLLETGFEYVKETNLFLNVLGGVSAVASDSSGWSVETKKGNQNWLIFLPKQQDSWMEKVAAAITTCGANVTMVYPEQEATEDKIEERIKTLLERADDESVHGVIYAWGIEEEDQRKIAYPFLHIAKCLLKLQKPPKVYVVTRDFHAVTDSQVTVNPAGATLSGMLKSLKNEDSNLFLRLVDLEMETGVDEVLFELAMSKETAEKERIQVAYRGGLRYEPRLCKATLAENLAKGDLQLPACAERYQLVLPKTKMINDLKFDVLDGEEVGKDEIEVTIKAYALNFRDIFAIIKPSAEFEKLNGVGLDFAGLVTRVGENVKEDKFQVGDRVFGVNFKDAQLPSHLVVDADYVLKIPDKMTFAEAATMPAVFATSIHCLITVGKMKKGDTVLIHTGSGGVGLSAIQLAKQVGANIITTAGNPRKRAYLKGLGIEHVFHSRDTSYQENIMRVTNGKGVDLVLNSITGKGFKEATLAVCARNARFIEMSKLAVWSVAEVKEMRPDVEYSIVDLMSLERPVWIKLMSLMKAFLEQDRLSTIPYVQFDALRVRQALQYFQKAKHIGKVVVTMPQTKTVENQWKVEVPLFNQFSTYVITGGLGGIGFEVCKWMLERGATDIVLIGRNPPKANIAQEIDRLNQKGYNVMVRLADVGNEEQIKAVIDDIASKYKPIRGIHHCAGVLLDNMYTNQVWSAFETTYNPKVKGTMNIHRLTTDLPLEHFVLYSSITALFGTPAQSNHASANSFEDAFAHYRYSLGLPATAINWGQWASVGVAREINLSGVLPVSVARMLNGLEEALRAQCCQVAIADFENFYLWATVCPTTKYYLDERLLRTLKSETGQSGSMQLKSSQFWKEVDEKVGKEEKMEVVMTYMKAILRTALRMDADEPISNDANMSDLGVDSLMLIELKNSIQSLLGSRITVTSNLLKNLNTIRELSACIVNKRYDDNESTEKSPALSQEQLTDLLKADCSLDKCIQPDLTKSVEISKVKTIFITGSTGQVGPWLISWLSQHIPLLERIVCLIRTRKDECPVQKLRNVLANANLLDKVDMNKVDCVKGDVALPNFGLQSEIYEQLANSVDAVFHLAVESNHVESYEKLRNVNVGGTLNMLRFASHRKAKHVYYTSSWTCAFMAQTHDGALSDNWLQEDLISTLVENKILGYALSRYVCEILIKQAVERGIPCKLFRFAHLLGDSQTGQLSNYRTNHYILRFISYLKIKAMPDYPMPGFALPVDTCVELSMKLFWNECVPNEVYNLLHPQPQLEVEFVNLAKQHFGTDVELVDFQNRHLAEKLSAKGTPLELLKEFYDEAHKLENISNFPAFQGYMTFPARFFENRKLLKFIPNFTENIPSSMEIIRKSLDYVKAQGFFEKFGL